MDDELRLRSLPNFRDVGGLACAGSSSLRRGRVFRSELPRAVSRADLARIHELGIGLVLDLRTDRERTRRRAIDLAGTERRTISLHEDPAFDVGLGHLARFLSSAEGEARFRAFVSRYYRHLVHDRATRIGDVMTSIARADRPVWIHCTAGRDRTGMVVGLLQSALGVDETEVVNGFRETDIRYAVRLERLARVLRAMTLLRVPEARIRAVLRSQSETFVSILRELRETHGSIEGYVREACRVDDAGFAALRASLVS